MNNSYFRSSIYAFVLGGVDWTDESMELQTTNYDLIRFTSELCHNHNVECVISHNHNTKNKWLWDITILTNPIEQSSEIHDIVCEFGENKSFPSLPDKFFLTNVTLAVWIGFYAQLKKNYITLDLDHLKIADRKRLAKVFRIICKENKAITLNKSILSVKNQAYKKISDLCRQTNIYFESLEEKLCGM